MYCLHFINPLISKKSTILSHSYLANLQNIIIDDFSGIGQNFKLYNATVKIGKDVMIAPNVIIQGGGHNFERIDIPIRKQGNIGFTSVEIQDDVWIGNNVLILAKNTIIGKGSIIGAGAVVTKDIPEYSIVAGNPAKIIKSRMNKI